MFANSKQTKNKNIGQIVSWTITGIIALAILFIAFVKVVPGFDMYVVRSDSMSPDIWAGDIIFTGPVQEVQPGQIITFEKDQKIVTHRAVSVENGMITTKGDANEDADRGTITLKAVQGSYLFKVPGIGYITSLTHTKNGWLLMVIIPSFILILFLVKDILKEIFTGDKKKSAAGISPVMQTVAVGADNAMTSHPAKAAKSEPAAHSVKPAARPQVIEAVAAQVKTAEVKKEMTSQVFSNKETNDSIRSEMKKILADLS